MDSVTLLAWYRDVQTDDRGTQWRRCGEAELRWMRDLWGVDFLNLPCQFAAAIGWRVIELAVPAVTRVATEGGGASLGAAAAPMASRRRWFGHAPALVRCQ
jgi:hypothetical protein